MCEAVSTPTPVGNSTSLVDPLIPKDINGALQNTSNNNLTIWAMLLGVAILGSIMLTTMYALITKATKSNDSSNASVSAMINQQFDSNKNQQEQFSRLIENNTKALNVLTRELMQIQSNRTIEQNEISLLHTNILETKRTVHDLMEDLNKLESTICIQLNNSTSEIQQMKNHCISLNNRENQKLGRILVRLNIITEDQLLNALKRQNLEKLREAAGIDSEEVL
jgi:chromosome segregation ATPase